MSAYPPKQTPKGTRHVLICYGKRKATFEWTGEAWSKPGTGWGTKPAFMQALGWKYVKPEEPTK